MIIAIGTGPDRTDEATGLALETLSKQYPNEKIKIWDNPTVAIQESSKGRIGVLAMDTNNRRYDVAAAIQAIHAGRIDAVVLPYGYSATRIPIEVMADSPKGAIKSIISINPQLGAGWGSGRLKELAAITAKVNPDISVSWNMQAGKNASEITEQVSALPNFKLNVANNPYAMHTCVPINRFKEGGVSESKEPFSGWGRTTSAFGDLPDMTKFKYREAGIKSKIQAADNKGEVVLDRIAKPYHYEKLVDGMDTLIGIAGATQGKPGASSVLGSLEAQGPSDFYLAGYGGSARVLIYSDKTFGISIFKPVYDKQGRPLSADHLAASNWQPLSRDEAINSLQSEMTHQTYNKGDPDSSFKNVFKGVFGRDWWNGFAQLGPADHTLAEINKMPLNDWKEFTFQNRGPVKSTIGAFLDGSIPITKQEDTFYREYYQADQLRKRSGQEIGFRKWFEAKIEIQPEAIGSVSSFQNLGASSFGRERLADVWYQQVNAITPIDKAVQDTMAQAKQTGADKVSLIYKPDALSFAKKLSDQLTSQGLKNQQIRSICRFDSFTIRSLHYYLRKRRARFSNSTNNSG